MTKLAPKGRVRQMMGLWFIAAALSNLFAGLTAGQLRRSPERFLERGDDRRQRGASPFWQPVRQKAMGA